MASQWRQQGLGFEALSIYFVIGGGASLDPCPVPAQQPTSKPSSSGRPSWSPTRGEEGEEERRRAGAREETEVPHHEAGGSDYPQELPYLVPHLQNEGENRNVAAPTDAASACAFCSWPPPIAHTQEFSLFAANRSANRRPPARLRPRLPLPLTLLPRLALTPSLSRPSASSRPSLAAPPLAVSTTLQEVSSTRPRSLAPLAQIRARGGGCTAAGSRPHLRRSGARRIRSGCGDDGARAPLHAPARKNPVAGSGSYGGGQAQRSSGGGAGACARFGCRRSLICSIRRRQLLPAPPWLNSGDADAD
jgi:hypothetical protein